MSFNYDYMIEAYNLAMEEGYVQEWGDYEIICNAECDDCPAGQTCDTLSEKGSFDIYKENYKKLKEYRDDNLRNATA